MLNSGQVYERCTPNYAELCAAIPLMQSPTHAPQGTVPLNKPVALLPSSLRTDPVGGCPQRGGNRCRDPKGLRTLPASFRRAGPDSVHALLCRSPELLAAVGVALLVLAPRQASCAFDASLGTRAHPLAQSLNSATRIHRSFHLQSFARGVHAFGSSAIMEIMAPIAG